MVGRDGISHKKLHNKTNTMKHVSVVMTVVTRYGRKRWNHKKATIKKAESAIKS